MLETGGKKPFFSIVIATYNSEGTLGYTLDSMTLDSVNLAGWDGAKSSTVPAGWTANGRCIVFSSLVLFKVRAAVGVIVAGAIFEITPIYIFKVAIHSVNYFMFNRVLLHIIRHRINGGFSADFGGFLKKAGKYAL